MKFLRDMFDSAEPLFKTGPLKLLYPLYEAKDTFLFNTGETTKGQTHVRDALDSKRMMIMVVVALLPCIFMACYNTGFQAAKILETSAAGYEVDLNKIENVRYLIMDTLGLEYKKAGDFYQNFSNPWLLMCHVVHGLLYFLPVYIVTMAVGGLCEVIFCIIRGHEITEGFLVTGMLFPLTLPPTIPLWQVALGIAFGVVIGKEIFGGVGYNFLNPALTARAFLYFAYPKQISGTVWTAVDGYTGATALGTIANSKSGTVAETIANTKGVVEGYGGSVTMENTWWDFFFGNVHGSMGETSTLCCLIGAAILIITRVGSWRIMLGVVAGMAAFSGLLNFIPKDETVYHILPQWHLVLGGFAFGTVFMATDPVSASMTRTGKYIYGALIGVVTVIVRTINPAFPEGIMLAILFGNVFAPLIDYFVVQANIKRRIARNG